MKITRSIHVMAALFVVLAIVFAQLRFEDREVPTSDSLAYLSVALDIHDKGIFTDGIFAGHAIHTGPHGEGMFFAPLYPYFLSRIMAMDTGFYETASCLVAARNQDTPNCPLHLDTVVLWQGLIAGIGLFLVWMSGAALTNNRMSVAWGALALAAMAQCYAYYAGLILTENLTFPFFTAFCLFLAVGVSRRHLGMVFMAGLTLGAATLARPVFPYLAYVLFAAGILWFFIREGSRRWLMLCLCLIAGFAAAVSPWVWRNGMATGHYQISGGYAPFILIQRVAYNRMTLREFGASFVYGLPDFGDRLAEKLFPREDFRRFDYQEPDGFYLAGNTTLRDDLTQKAGGWDHLLSYLLRHEILAHPVKHTLVTLSLAWRGMWVSKYWGLITIPIFVIMSIIWWRRRAYSFLIFSFPAWFMLGFHAFTSVNVVRYNLLLVPCLSIAAAWGIGIMVTMVYNRFRNPQSIHSDQP